MKLFSACMQSDLNSCHARTSAPQAYPCTPCICACVRVPVCCSGWILRVWRMVRTAHWTNPGTGLSRICTRTASVHWCAPCATRYLGRYRGFVGIVAPLLCCPPLSVKIASAYVSHLMLQKTSNSPWQFPWQYSVHIIYFNIISLPCMSESDFEQWCRRVYPVLSRQEAGDVWYIFRCAWYKSRYKNHISHRVSCRMHMCAGGSERAVIYFRRYDLLARTAFPGNQTQLKTKQSSCC